MRAALEALRGILREMGSAAIAFSGGVDSAFLLKTAHDALGGRAVAMTARLPFLPERELEEAAAFCRREGICHVVFDFDALSVPGLARNPPERCYLCKRGILERALAAAKRQGLAFVAEGSNADDDGARRPGMRAVRELGVRSPLREAGLGKAAIRALSRELGIPVWDKPSFACLATRLAHGEAITPERLSRVERAERFLGGLGLRLFRVRLHGDVARIEAPPADFPLVLDRRGEIHAAFRSFGIVHVSLDLLGFRPEGAGEAPAARPAQAAGG